MSAATKQSIKLRSFYENFDSFLLFLPTLLSFLLDRVFGAGDDDEQTRERTSFMNKPTRLND